MLFSGSKIGRMPPSCNRHPLHSVPCPVCNMEGSGIKKDLLEWVKLNKDKNDALLVKNPEHVRDSE